MEVVIPFSLLPPKLLYSMAQKFRGAGSFAYTAFPNLREDLIQARMDVNAREYSSIAVIASVFNSIVFFLLLVVLGMAVGVNILAIALIFGMVVLFGSLLTVMYYPQMVAGKRAHKVEANLISAVRQLIIEVKSGVPLYHAMTSVCDDYEDTSTEFRIIVTRISNGVSELDALAEATRENSSVQFRKVLWQISNALKAGGDVDKALETILAELVKGRVEDIHRFGQELSPWTMIYMLMAIIFPSLGITMLIVMTSFLPITVPKAILPVTILILIGFQAFFIKFVKSRRPTI